jgi:antitoxin component YwqK of YwqJK toxin-antitoxin module
MTAKSIICSCLLLLLLSSCTGDKLIKSHYDSGELKAEWHINGQGQKHGIEKQFHASGELKGLIKWQEDQMDSAATYYWKNGNPRKRVEYKMGSPFGTTAWFFENGKVQKEENYQEGDREGSAKEFYENGKPKSVAKYKDNVREGPSQTWYENGNMEKELSYKGGRINGEFVQYHETGSRKQVGLMVQGEKAGQWREYDEKGRDLFECVYVIDILSGAFTVYYPASGKVRALGEFKGGMLHGQVIVFNESGGRVKTQQWIKGKSADGTNDLSWLPSEVSLKPEEFLAK